MRTVPVRRSLPGALALISVLLLSACGDENAEDVAERPKAQVQSLAVEVSEQSKDKFAMTAPKSVAAGIVEISLKAPAGKESHDAQLVRVEGDHSIEEVLKFIGAEGAPTPEWVFAAGGVGQTAGGATGRSTQELTPGTYYIVDTSEPQGENVKSYAERGATAALEVTGEAAGAELPAATAKITMKDYSYVTSGLKAGKNTVELDNPGKEIHHVIAFPYAPGADFAAVKKVFSQEGEPSGPPPVDFQNVTGTAALEGGTKQVTELQLKPGKYALVCFISDRKGGPPHLAKGMIAEAVIE